MLPVIFSNKRCRRGRRPGRVWEFLRSTEREVELVSKAVFGGAATEFVFAAGWVGLATCSW